MSCWILWMQFRLPFPIFCPWNPSKTRPGSAGVRCLWRCWTAIRRNLANLMKTIEIPNIGSPSRSSGQASLSSGRRPIGLSWRVGHMKAWQQRSLKGTLFRTAATSTFSYFTTTSTVYLLGLQENILKHGIHNTNQHHVYQKKTTKRTLLPMGLALLLHLVSKSLLHGL